MLAGFSNVEELSVVLAALTPLIGNISAQIELNQSIFLLDYYLF
jgi:hypothetical protein